MKTLLILYMALAVLMSRHLKQISAPVFDRIFVCILVGAPALIVLALTIREYVQFRRLKESHFSRYLARYNASPRR